VFALLEAAGLAGFAVSGRAAVALAALVAFALGMALAVPSLGVLALQGVPATSQGAAAGLFFAWFDAGVAAGGPAVGLATRWLSAPGGLLFAAFAVAAAVPVAVAHRRRPSAPAGG
jgi:hypothetical protein